LPDPAAVHLKLISHGNCGIECSVAENELRTATSGYAAIGAGDVSNSKTLLDNPAAASGICEAGQLGDESVEEESLCSAGAP
jgi:hypothetical protein